MTWLIIGLGNPGKKYENTRHNIGFNVINLFAEEIKISFLNKKIYDLGEGYLGSTPIFLLKPLTFMNLSGKAVVDFVKYKNSIEGSKTIVIYDDLDLPLGKLRLKWNGSGGGHRGVNSVISEWGTKDFFHLKIGIGRPPLKQLVENYVLEKFNKEEREIIDSAIIKAIACIRTLIEEGPQIAMNKFNG
ncbi:MAG: aminoacyl-tRNA hydrolase [Proteobacteria bacterium]|nr:aminoacyl-tRNA hydrolase [Pseudomonadota bacterium]